jgi:hypothetical protein
MERKDRQGREDQIFFACFATFAFNVDRNRNEGTCIGQTDLRQMQDRPAPRRRARDLFEPETQTETGMIGELVNW